MTFSPIHRFLAKTCTLLIALLALSGCGSLYMKDIATDALDPTNRGDAEPSIAVNPNNTREIAIVAFSENWTATTGDRKRIV